MSVSSGRATITGRRLPPLWVNLRTAGNIAFIPCILGIFALAIVWATGSSAALVWGALCAAMFALSLGTLVYTDIWFPAHALVESASWPVAATAEVKRVQDSTTSVGAPLPSMILRGVGGKNALRLRVPLDSGQALRTLVLRSAPDGLALLEVLLTTG